MSNLVRLSLSLEKSLYDKLERMVRRSGYKNRSEYVRDLIRDQLVEDEWNENQPVVGTITIIYNHHKRMLSETLTDVQHQHHDAILATTHVHLDAEMCAESIIVKASPAHVREITDELRQQKGVLHAALSIGSTGQQLT
ncbi:MAG: nickel-responsive transcriptional regulator NikR [Verrucomicrobiota bacterium]